MSPIVAEVDIAGNETCVDIVSIKPRPESLVTIEKPPLTFLFTGFLNGVAVTVTEAPPPEYESYGILKRYELTKLYEHPVSMLRLLDV
jgi:hypothetical protein